MYQQTIIQLDIIRKNLLFLKDGIIKEVFVSFQGVESAYYLYINGEYVGYSEDSFTGHDFNIGKFLKEGEMKYL